MKGWSDQIWEPERTTRIKIMQMTIMITNMTMARNFGVMSDKRNAAGISAITTAASLIFERQHAS